MYLQGKIARNEIVRKFIAREVNVKYNIHKSNEQFQTEIQPRRLLAVRLGCMRSDRARARECALRKSGISVKENREYVRRIKEHCC